MGVCKAARRVLLLSPGPRVSKGPVGGNVAKLLNSTKRFCQQEWGKQDRNPGGLGLFLNHVVLKYVLKCVGGISFLRLSIWTYLTYCWKLPSVWLRWYTCSEPCLRVVHTVGGLGCRGRGWILWCHCCWWIPALTCCTYCSDVPLIFKGHGDMVIFSVTNATNLSVISSDSWHVSKSKIF